jgi:hypothetical protein
MNTRFFRVSNLAKQLWGIIWTTFCPRKVKFVMTWLQTAYASFEKRYLQKQKPAAG